MLKGVFGMNHKEVAKRIAQAIGKDNVVAAAHCATRLRLVVKDVKVIDQAALDNDPDLKGTFNANGQYQIIVGPGDVNTVYDEFIKIVNIKEASKEELKNIAADNKDNIIMKFIKVLSDIFVPLIPALTAGGLLMAINNVLTGQGLFGAQSIVQMFPQWKGFAEIVNMMSSAPFTFLPILIAFSATKRFGGNPYLGVAAGMMLVMPNLVNGYGVAESIATGHMTYWHVFGLNIAQAGYQGQVIPVIGVAFILANLEKFFHKHLNDAVDFTFTPMLSIIITGFLTFTLVGPALRIVSNGVTDSLVWAYQTLGAVGMGIFGLGYSAIVLTGLHQSFPAIETTLLADIAKTGGSFIFPVAAMANIAQGAATFAVFFVTKNKQQKSLTTSAGISAMLGITEPALFGVNLKLKFPFFIGLIASGISSFIIGLLHVLSVSMGPAGIIGFIAIAPKSIPSFMMGAIISFVIAFVGTYLYGKKAMKTTEEEIINEAPATPEVVERLQDEKISAPVTGRIVDLASVPDPVFASEAMGKGIAIMPTSQDVLAPVTGVITIAADTGHAYGIKSDDGAEVLIHIGLDTVNLNGVGFEKIIQQGQHVSEGDLLGHFDIDKIKQAGLTPLTMTIVTNTAGYAQVDPLLTVDKDAMQGEEIIQLHAKKD